MKFRFLTVYGLLLLLSGPASVAQVTLSRATLEEVGMSGAILDGGVSLFREAVEKDELRGVVLLVARHGKVVLHEPVGWRDKEATQPMEKDTLFRMASNTKPFIAAAVLMLVEEKKLQLDHPVRQYLPSFDNYRAGWIKVRHLLNHTSGFRISSIFLSPLMEKTAEHPDAPNLQLEVDRFGRIGADEIPGTTYSYSNPGFNTLGALIEIASGQSLEDFLKQRIYDPLKMKDSGNHETKADQSRMGKVYRWQKGEAWSVRWKPGDQPNYPFVRASGGMISTAWDYARFLQMLLNGGQLAGTRLLSPTTVELMTENHVGDLFGVFAPGMGFGLGFAVRLDVGAAGEHGSVGEYGWGGAYHSTYWVDPVEDLVVVYFTQVIPAGGLDDHARLRALVYSAIVESAAR